LVVTPFFPRLSTDVTWKTPVHWDSQTQEHRISGILYPWSRASLLFVIDENWLRYAVYYGDDDVRIYADSSISLSVNRDDITPVPAPEGLPAPTILSSGIVEDAFSCASTPSPEGNGNWQFPCGTLLYRGEPIAELGDLTLREALLVPHGNRAVIHVGSGHVSSGSEPSLVAVVELPQ
jgi:hypothetical protein